MNTLLNTYLSTKLFLFSATSLTSPLHIYHFFMNINEIIPYSKCPILQKCFCIILQCALQKKPQLIMKKIKFTLTNDSKKNQRKIAKLLRSFEKEFIKVLKK